MTVKGKQRSERTPLIAHVIHGLSMGGMENGLVNIINNLPENEFRHAIICLTKTGEFERRIKTINTKSYELHKKPGLDLRVYWKFWRLIRELRPSIVHTRNIGTLDLTPVAALAGVPVRIHGEHGWHASNLHGKSRKYAKLRRICDPFIGTYVAVSANIGDWLQSEIGIRDAKVVRINNGVDATIFAPGHAKTTLPALKYRNDMLVLGTVGRMDPIKGLDVLVQSVARLLKKRPDLRNTLRLAIVGDGPAYQSIKEYVVQYDLQDMVLLSGARDDIAEVLRGLDIFVIASRNEGMSNTILEAMATGLPIVATRVGGNAELVVHNETGVLVKPDSSDEIVDAILQYIDNPKLRQRHGEAARRRAVNEFGLELMISKYAELYRRSIER